MSGIMAALAGNGGGFRIGTVLASATVTGISTSPAVCSSSISVESDGTIDYIRTGFGTTANAQQWSVPSGGSFLPGNQYWVRFNNVSGAPAIGTAGTWQALSSARSIGTTRSGASLGTTVYSFTMSFATDAAGSNIVATSPTITTQATVLDPA